MAIATFDKIPKKKSGITTSGKKTATFDNVKKISQLTDEERRAQIVSVTDSSKPDAAPVTMTMGEYEDMIAAEKKEYEAKVSAAVKENSRLRAMSVHENQQHSKELSDKKTNEFISRYKLFTPKEERMHGDELKISDPYVINTALSFIQKGDYESARAALGVGVTSGQYSQSLADKTFNELVRNNTITPETRLEGLKKAAADSERKANERMGEYLENDFGADSDTARRSADIAGAQAGQYIKMRDNLDEKIDKAPYEAKKAEKEAKRDESYATSQREIQTQINSIQYEIAPIEASAVAFTERMKEKYPTRAHYEGRISQLETKKHLTEEEKNELALLYRSADVLAWEKDTLIFETLEAQDAYNEKQAQLFYANGLNTFAALSENDKMQLVEYIRDGKYKETYKRLKSEIGKDDFERMLETIASLENAVEAAERDIANVKFANKYPVVASIASIFTSLIGGVSAVGGIALHGIDNIGEGAGYKAPIDMNSAAFAPTKHATVTRGTVAEDIEKDIGGTGGKVASFLYQTGMSGVDSLAASFTGNWGGTLLLGTSSAASAFLDAKERGVSDTQAIWTGLFAGAFETLFERVSIGNLNALKETPIGNIKDILKNVAKSSLVNATEEGLTQAATAISDYLINGDFSVYGAMYNDLLKQGISPEAAKAKAKEAFWKENLVAAAGGAVMGIGFAGGAGGINYATGYKGNTVLGGMYQNEDGTYNLEAVNALIAEGIVSQNESIRSYAAQLRTTVEKGAKVDVKQLGALQRALAAEQKAKTVPAAKTQQQPTEKNREGGAPFNVMSNEAVASALGVSAQSRGNVLWPNGDGTNSLITFEEAERRKTAQGDSDTSGKTRVQNEEKSLTAAKNAVEASILSENDKKVLRAIDFTKKGIGAATDAQARVVSTLSGRISNSAADTVANSAELSAAFEALTGIKLEGSAAQKRKAVKQNALAAIESYRMKVKERVARAVRYAAHDDDSEGMTGEGGALGAFGRAAYRAFYQSTTDAYTRDGLGAEKVKQYNREFGAYYMQGFNGMGFSYMDTRMTEAEARAAFEAGVKDSQIAEATTMSARSGILHGASESEIELAERLSRALGKDVIFVNALGVDKFNGCYVGDGNIYLQVGAKDPIVQIVAHEFVHSLEEKRMYRELREFVFNYLTKDGKTEEQLREEKRKQKGYAGLGDTKIDKEIVAQFVAEHLLTDEKVMRSLVQEKGRTFAEKLHDLWNAFVAKIKSAFGKTDKDIQSQLDMIERGRELLAHVIRSEDVGEDSDVRYTYAGERAKTANIAKLSEAQRMENEGTDSETIRKATGWHKGYDGQWRFEIDDSKMEISTNGAFTRDIEVRRYVELLNKIYLDENSDYTQEEMNELSLLNERFRDESIMPNKLGDLIKHEALFSAYPELAEVWIHFSKNTEDTSSYHPGFNEIVLPFSYKRNPKKLKEALLHEIQHAVQEIENFSIGSNPREAGSYENYNKTAGEIEARDTASRADLDAEQRKNTRPDIDRTDVVFADGGVLYVSAKNNEDSSIREQIRANLDRLNVMQPVVNIDYASISKKDIRSVVETEFKKIGYHIDRKDFGLIEIGEGEIKKSLNYLFSDGEKAALLSIPRVLKRGIEIERRSKHKGQSYGTVTIAAPITINGTQIGIVGAVVKMTGQNRYRTHRILTPDGSEFVFNDNKNDAEFTFSDMRTENGTQRPDINPASTNSISNSDENVKGDSKIRFSFAEDGTQQEVEDFLNEQDASEDEFLLRMLHYQENPEEATEVILQHEMGGKENFIDRAIHTKTDEAMRREAEKSKTGKARRESIKQRLMEEYAKSVSFVQRKLVDSGYAVDQIGKEAKDSRLYAYYNAARASTNAAVYMLTGSQTDIDGNKVGEGLNAIFAPIKEKGDDYYREFQKYLYHLHNADRMSRQNDARIEEAKARFAEFKIEHPELDKYADYQIERIATSDFSMPEQEAAAEYVRLRDEMRREENMRNKPIFGHEVDTAHSLIAAQALEKQHPEFIEHRDKIYKYIENLLQYRVDSGLITHEDMEQLKQIYPHYVPTYRVTDSELKKMQRNKRSVMIGKTIGRASGGDEALMPLDQALAKLTLRVVREGSKNNFGRRLLYNGAVKLKEHIKNITEYEPQGKADAFANADSIDADVDPAFRKTNTFVVYDSGQMWEMEIGDALYEAVQALSPEVEEMNWGTRLLRGMNKLYKELITGKNPFFIVKNFERDLQDAGLYTKDLVGFAKAYPRAWKEMTTNGELWQQYQALGGLYSSLLDYKTGTAEKQNKKGVGKVIEKIEAANMLIEQAPRFAEFISTIERGGKSHDNLMTAMHNAADITVNFGRSGTWGKYLNERFVPFLNPGIQGFDKTVRMFKDNHGAKEWSVLVAKAMLLGIAPSVVNALAAAIFGWDDWEDIKDRDKDTYYLIRAGEGKYIKIPKGRVTASLSMTAMRLYDVATGEDVNFGEYLNTLSDQVAPANPLKTNLFTPLYDSAIDDPENPGKTWYGGDIESQRLQNYAPSERFDEKTDIVSRWIGKVTGLSPKKINYLLDSYTGVVGDILLPALVPSKGGLDAVGKVFEKTFVLDAVSTNRLNNDFYTMLDSVTYNKNSSNATALDKLLYKYMSKRSSAVSEINSAIKEIETDPNLSNKERADLLRAQQMLRNTVQKNAMDQINYFYENAEYYYQNASGDEEEKIDYAYLMANKKVFGAEYAIETYNKSTYKKAQECHAEGVSYDDFFNYYFTANRIEETGTAKTNEKRSILLRMKTDEDTKISLYRAYISDSRDDDIRAFSDAGLEFDDFLRVQNQYATFDSEYSKAKEKANAFELWVSKQGFTKKQREVILDCFKYFMHIPS